MSAQRGHYERPTPTAPLDPQKVDTHIADQADRIAAQRVVAERLTTIADDEWREVYRLEGQLRAFREAVNRVGLTDGTSR